MEEDPITIGGVGVGVGGGGGGDVPTSDPVGIPFQVPVSRGLIIINYVLTSDPFSRALIHHNIVPTIKESSYTMFSAWLEETHQEPRTEEEYRECVKFCAVPLRRTGDRPDGVDVVQNFLIHIKDAYVCVVATVAESVWVRALTNIGYERPIMGVKMKAVSVCESKDIITAIGYSELLDYSLGTAASSRAESVRNHIGWRVPCLCFVVFLLFVCYLLFGRT